MVSNMSMKLIFHKESNKVLYAEAGKDVVDFFFYILTLPIATIIRIFSNYKKDMEGCLLNLYKSYENLNQNYIQTNRVREDILKPRTSFPTQEILLLPDTVQSTINVKVEFYQCPVCKEDYYVRYTQYSTCKRCQRNQMNSLAVLSMPVSKCGESGPGLVKDLVTYIVMDDLEIKPMSTVSSISLLNKFNVKNVGDLQEIVVVLGMNEAFKIIEASLKVKEVLTSVYIDEIVKQAQDDYDEEEEGK